MSEHHRTCNEIDCEWGCDKSLFHPSYGFAFDFLGLYNEAFWILMDRQRKYGPDNISQQGLYGVVTRMINDKCARLKRSMQGTIVNGQVTLDLVDTKDESVEDTLLDIANYSLIALALKRGIWGAEADDTQYRLELRRA